MLENFKKIFNPIEKKPEETQTKNPEITESQPEEVNEERNSEIQDTPEEIKDPIIQSREEAEK